MAAKKKGYDAEAKSKERAAEETTIGERSFRPVKLTNSRARQIRALGREATDIEKKHGDESDEAQDASFDAAVAQLHLMLRDTESGEAPTAEYLEEELDVRELGPLLTWVMGGDPENPPTAETPSNGASASSKEPETTETATTA